MTQTKKIPIIIDCDPGADDAFALLILYKNRKMFDIKLMCSTAGNTPIELTTRNLQFFAQNFFNGVRLAKGLPAPLVKTNVSNATDVHGEGGLGDFQISDQTYPYEEDSAKAMADVIKNSPEPITLITLGPMTNIARLLVAYPEVKDNIKEINAMIGAITGHGNIKPYAEFNAYFDPEACDIVVKSGIPIIFNTIELGEDARIEKDRILNHAINSQEDSMIKLIARGMHEITDSENLFVYDADTIMSMVNPELFDFVPCDVTISTNKRTSGRCVMTQNPNGIYKYLLIKDTTKLTDAIVESLFNIDK